MKRLLLPLSVSLALGAARVDVAILPHRFEPDSARLEPGDTVRWTHADATAHTVRGTGAETWNSGPMSFGDVYSRVFASAGEFAYVCDYHPMAGKILVGAPVGLRSADRETPEDSLAPENRRDALGRRTRPAPSRPALPARSSMP